MTTSPTITTLIDRFIIDRKANGRAAQTIRDYEYALGLFAESFSTLDDLSRDCVMSAPFCVGST